MPLCSPTTSERPAAYNVEVYMVTFDERARLEQESGRVRSPGAIAADA
jgi:hypothetical protein